MAKEVTNRSSEGVRSTYFPRPDLPQDGWISVQERSLAGIRTPPWIEELNSFRPDDRRTVQRKRIHLTDFSQQWWGTFVPAIAPPIARQDPAREESNDCDRAFDPRGRRKRNQVFYPHALEQTESNAFSVGGFDPSVYPWLIPSTDRATIDHSLYHDLEKRTYGGGSGGPAGSPPFTPSGQDWHVDSTETAKGKRYQRDTPTDQSWQYSGNDPSTENWTIDSIRLSVKRKWPIDNIDVDWISATFAAAFTPSSYPWLIPSTDRARVDRSLYHDLEKRPTGGGSSGPPAAPPYDPTQLGWSIESGIPSSKKKPRAWLDALPSVAHFGLLDSRLTEPSYDQLWNAYLPKSGRKRSGYTEPSAGWTFVNLPAAFDPTISPQSEDARMVNRAKARPQLDQPQTGWQYTNLPTPFDPQFSPDSTDGRLADRYKKHPQLDQPQDAWLFSNLPAVFDASVTPYSDVTRQADRRKRTPQLDQPLQDWITSAIPPFDFTVSPYSDDVRQRDRRKRVPQLDQVSQDWITTGIPPFDPQFLIQGPESFRARPHPQLELPFYETAFTMPWVHDVIPLTDPEPIPETPTTVIVVGGDDAPKKHKKRKEPPDVFKEMEQTIRALLHPEAGDPEPDGHRAHSEEAVASLELERRYQALVGLAQDSHRSLQVLAQIRREIDEYQLRLRQEQDDEDFLMFS